MQYVDETLCMQLLILLRDSITHIPDLLVLTVLLPLFTMLPVLEEETDFGDVFIGTELYNSDFDWL